MPARVEGDGDAVQASSEVSAEPEEDEGVSLIPDRLMTELTAHRTLALRQALGDHPDVAFLAALHALCLKVFYRYALDSCLELDLKSVSFGTQAPGLNDSASAQALGERHQAWTAALPKEPAELWDALTELRPRQPPGAVRPLRGLSASTPCTRAGTGVRGRWPTPTGWRRRWT